MSKHIQPGNGDGPDCEPRKLRMIVRSSIQGSQTNVSEKHYGIGSTKKKLVLGLSANPESMFKKNFEKRKWGKKQQQLGLAVAAVADEYPQKQRSRSNTTRVKVEQFRIELSTCEIEDDFINITGHPPSRKPIKRPNVVQNRLNVSCLCCPIIIPIFLIEINGQNCL